MQEGRANGVRVWTLEEVGDKLTVVLDNARMADGLEKDELGVGMLRRDGHDASFVATAGTSGSE